jgi:hypothetical protein
VPAQALVEQDLVDPAALHRNPFVLMQVGGQSIQGPGSKRQPEGLRLGERARDHGGGLLGRVGRPAARTGPILEGFQAFRIEATDALAHGLAIQADLRAMADALSPQWARKRIWARCTLWAGAVRE